MSEHSKNVSEQVVKVINEAADRACSRIWEDAERAIGDMEARAEALYQIEIEENGRFIRKGDHLFATEIDLSYLHGIQLGGANLEANGYRFQIGSGPMAGNSGPELERGKRYRMIVAFQELGKPPEREVFCDTCGVIKLAPDENGECDGCLYERRRREGPPPRPAFREIEKKRNCGYCWTLTPEKDLGGECGEWCPKCVEREANESRRAGLCPLMDNSDYGPCDRKEGHVGVCGSRKHFKAEFFDEEANKATPATAYCDGCGRSATLTNGLCKDCTIVPVTNKCKACNAEIYIGNCCNEVCTSKWLASIRKANTAMSKGRRACHYCGAWHELKSNRCGKCASKLV